MVIEIITSNGKINVEEYQEINTTMDFNNLIAAHEKNAVIEYKAVCYDTLHPMLFVSVNGKKYQYSMELAQDWKNAVEEGVDFTLSLIDQGVIK